MTEREGGGGTKVSTKKCDTKKDKAHNKRLNTRRYFDGKLQAAQMYYAAIK